MFRTLSRILRNNDFIRIFAICQICILICTVSSFATGGNPPTQDVNDVIQTTNNFTVWTDYTQNFSIYYGHHDVSYSEALLNSIAQTLKYHGQGTSYHIITNSSSNGASPTYYISGFLEDVTWNQWQLNEQQKANKDAINNVQTQILTTGSSIISTLGTINSSNSNISTNSNYINAYTSQIANTLGGSNSGNLVDIKNYLHSLENIDWKNTSSQLVHVYDPNGNEITSFNTRLSFSYADFEFYNPYQNGQNLYRVKLPVYPYTYAGTNTAIDRIELILPYNNNIYTIVPSNDILFDYSQALTVVNISPVNQFQENTYMRYRVYFNSPFSITNVKPYIQYLSSDSLDYMLQNYYISLRQIANKNNDDIIDAINDIDFTATIDGGDFSLIVPVLDPDVEFNMDVDLSVGDQGDITDLVNDTKDLTETGISVQELLDTLNDVLELFFNQSNKDTVETISTQYHTFY